MRPEDVCDAERDETDRRIHGKVDVARQHHNRLPRCGDGDDRSENGYLRKVRYRQELRGLGENEPGQGQHDDQQAELALARQNRHAAACWPVAANMTFSSVASSRLSSAVKRPSCITRMRSDM